MAESDRLRALRRYDILDSGPEPQFDRIVELAARMFDVPLSGISFLDADRIWFKARWGIEVDSLPRSLNLYGDATVDGAVMVNRDLAADPRFADHPHVRSESLRFCAVAPLRSPDGHCIGGISIIDRKPRPDMSDDGIAGLQALARLVESELERRLLTLETRKAADRFRNLAEMSSDWLWEADADHRITHVSHDQPGLAPLAPTTIGQRRWEYTNARPLLATWADYKALVDARQPFSGFEYEVRPSYGGYHVFRISGRPRYDENGRFVGYIGTGSDVTAQRQAEARLRDSEKSFRFLFEKNPNAMLLFEERSLRIVAANEAACTLYGYDHDTFVTLGLHDLRSEADQALRHAEPGDIDWSQRAERRARQRRRDGTVMDVVLNAAPMRFDGRDCLLVQVSDITRQLEAAARLAEAEASLRQKQKLESLGQLTDGIAHELNNILAAAMGNIELTVDELPLDSRGHTWLAEASRACERGADLVSRLMMFARRRPLVPREWALGPLLHALQGMVRGTTGSHIAVEFDIAADLDACRIDRNGLESVILNIAVNGRDAMPSGGTLRLTARNRVITADDIRGAPELRPGKWVEIVVSDTGFGMPPEVQARVFEPFFTTKAQGKGIGLGLSMVHGFVNQSGGFVTLASTPGRGSNFAVYLPSATITAERPGSVGAAMEPMRPAQ